MRVIAGSAGGLRLAAPKRGVRPTMDRVKAAIFSSLGDTVIGARVLDLFAGSGALGIEALSRGAAHVTFIERDPRAVALIRANLALIDPDAAARTSRLVRRQDAQARHVIIRAGFADAVRRLTDAALDGRSRTGGSVSDEVQPAASMTAHTMRTNPGLIMGIPLGDSAGKSKQPFQFRNVNARRRPVRRWPPAPARTAGS